MPHPYPNPYYRTEQDLGFYNPRQPQGPPMDQQVAPGLFEEHDPYAELAGYSPEYDFEQQQKAIARQNQIAGLRNIDLSQDNGTDQLLSILGKNPELLRHKEVGDLMNYADRFATHRAAKQSRNEALAYRMDQQRQREAQAAQAAADAQAEKEARASSLAATTKLFKLHPSDENFQEKFASTVGELEDSGAINDPKVFDTVKQMHQHYFTTPKPSRDSALPKELWDRHLALQDAVSEKIPDEDKVAAFKSAYGKKPVTKQDWDAADELVRGPIKQQFKQSAKTMEAIRHGWIPGLDSSQKAPAEVQPAPQPLSTETPTGPVRVRSFQEAAALPSGTTFITPDGQVRTKH